MTWDILSDFVSMEDQGGYAGSMGDIHGWWLSSALSLSPLFSVSFHLTTSHSLLNKFQIIDFCMLLRLHLNSGRNISPQSYLNTHMQLLFLQSTKNLKRSDTTRRNMQHPFASMAMVHVINVAGFYFESVCSNSNCTSWFQVPDA